MGGSASAPLVRPYDWPSESKSAAVRGGAAAARPRGRMMPDATALESERTFMYWLNPSSIQPYHVSLLLTVMGHHWWPVSWSAAPWLELITIGYSIPALGPSCIVNCGNWYGNQSAE